MHSICHHGILLPLTKAEKDQLRQVCQQRGISMSALARMACIDAGLTRKRSLECMAGKLSRSGQVPGLKMPQKFWCSEVLKALESGSKTLLQILAWCVCESPRCRENLKRAIGSLEKRGVILSRKVKRVKWYERK